LKSGRGEEFTSTNFPSIEASWRSPYYQLDPFVTFQSGFVHYDSALALQEGHIGARWRWKPQIEPSIGYFTYSLRGKNPGSSRLGSVDGLSLGLYSAFRIEDFMVRGWINGIYTEPFSFDTYVELSKIIDNGSSDRGLFFGMFFGYTAYRSELRNLINQYETFSENRFRVGLTIGLAGPEYMIDKQILLPAQVVGAADKNAAAALKDPDVKAALEAKVAMRARKEELAAKAPRSADHSSEQESDSNGTQRVSNEPPSSRSRINFRVNPLALRYRELSAGIDIRISDNWTLGPSLGYYSSTGRSANFDTQATIYRAGLRANWYPEGVFRTGWYVSPQFGQWLGTLSAGTGSSSGSTSFSGTEYQLLAGYQWFWSHFNLNLGAGYIGGSATGKTIRVAFPNGTSVDTDLGPIVLSGVASEFSFGWAF
jgi:hypothetical protein